MSCAKRGASRPGLRLGGGFARLRLKAVPTDGRPDRSARYGRVTGGSAMIRGCRDVTGPPRSGALAVDVLEVPPDWAAGVVTCSPSPGRR